MSFGRDSDFGRYFKDDTFVLWHYYDGGLQIKLIKTYDVTTGLTFAIYDEKKASYRQIFSPDTFEDLLEFINDVSLDYNKTIPGAFIDRTDDFLGGLPEAFTVSVNWDGSPDDRGADNKDFDVAKANRLAVLVEPYFYGLYFPGSEKYHRKDAVQVHYNFGTHGGNRQYGSSDNQMAMERIYGIIDDALGTVPTIKGRTSLEQFRHGLTMV